MRVIGVEKYVVR